MHTNAPQVSEKLVHGVKDKRVLVEAKGILQAMTLVRQNLAVYAKTCTHMSVCIYTSVHTCILWHIERTRQHA
jgi:hypothetical protein